MCSKEKYLGSHDKSGVQEDWQEDQWNLMLAPYLCGEGTHLVEIEATGFVLIISIVF